MQEQVLEKTNRDGDRGIPRRCRNVYWLAREGSSGNNEKLIEIAGPGYQEEQRGYSSPEISGVEW